MEKFYTLTAMSLITVVLSLTIRKQNGELAMILGLCGCVLVLSGMIQFLRPVIGFVRRIQNLVSWDTEILQSLLKITAVSLVSEIAALICSDAGNGALGKSLQILSVAVILWLALPMLEALLTMTERILVNL
jgi:stage III sporulation protein AD